MEVDFLRESVADLAARVARRELAARELTGVALDRIDALDGELNAFATVDPDGALAEAAAIDDRIAAGEDVGPLAGIPIGVKDLDDAIGFVTTKGSLLHAGDPVAADDSVLVERLRAAGCVVLGKTNTAEYGWKADTTNQLFGPTCNPWSRDRSPGGSSGGSAVAVAAGMVPLATGSDGGGSIRIPASVCGIAGFKASLGRVPVGGPHPPAWGHLTSPGPMTRTVRDLVLALDAVIGPDPLDLTSLPMPESSWSRSLEHVLPPLRVAWSPDLGYADVDGEVLEICEAALGCLEAAGTQVEVIEGVFDEDPVREWLTITMVRDLLTLEMLEERGVPDVWSKIDPGWLAGIEWARSKVSARDLVRAEDTGHRLNRRLTELFHGVSHLLLPTVAGQAPAIGGLGTIDGEPDANWVKLTYPFNLTRSPAGTVCAGFTGDGLPVGLQVVGPQHADVAVLRMMAVLEDLLAIDAQPDLRLLP